CRDNTSRLISDLLAFLASQILCERYSHFRVLAVRIYADCFASCERFHLSFCSIDVYSRKFYCSEVIAKCFSDRCRIPGTAAECAEFAFLEKCETASVLIICEFRIS